MQIYKHISTSVSLKAGIDYGVIGFLYSFLDWSMTSLNSCSWSGWSSPSTAWRSSCLVNCRTSRGNSFWMARRQEPTSNCRARFEQRPNWSSQRCRLDLIRFCIMDCLRFLSHPKSMQATVILEGCRRRMKKILQVVLANLAFPPCPMNPWYARFRT